MSARPPRRSSRDDRGFRIATGMVAALVLLLVIGIGFELTRQSLLSIGKFGLRFWTGKTWDPVSGEFGALPFIWGTLYTPETGSQVFPVQNLKPNFPIEIGRAHLFTPLTIS